MTKYKIIITGNYKYFDLPYYNEFEKNELTASKDDCLIKVKKYFNKNVPELFSLKEKSIKVEIEKIYEENILSYCI